MTYTLFINMLAWTVFTILYLTLHDGIGVMD
jgi:hypothetical protein